MSKTDGTPFSVIGVDLAADAKKTAFCQIVVTPEDGTAEMMPPKSGDDCSDEGLLKAFSSSLPEVKRIGIDAPFGWPRPFVSALSDAGHKWTDTLRERRHFSDLTLRATDRHIDSEVRGVTPLSVSASFIAVVAMRTALLLSRAPAPPAVDRSGMSGHFVEVYPAAALAQWKVPVKTKIKNGTSYKAKDKSKQVQVRGLRARMVQLLVAPLVKTTEEVKSALTQTDHAVDAAVSALVALMAEIDRFGADGTGKRLTEEIPSVHRASARTEGWIALPKPGSLECLGQRLEALKRVDPNPLGEGAYSRQG